MAVSRGDEAVWNRLDVPWPAYSATVAVPAKHNSVRCFSAVMKGRHAVSKILTCTAVVAEERLLHSLMYSFHHQMSRHRPYRSLKQVEQCLKHLQLMNLNKSIQDLVQLDPMKQKSENPKEALVPSQPVIEVVLVKILGGCKLLLRLLECCCTAFLLTLKHLCLEEYILFNSVVLGLLSRLWVLYRGVLKSLISLYGSLFELLQEVSKIEPRPYIKGFDFPSEINTFLGITYAEIKKKMPKAFVTKVRTGWMDKLFPVSKTTSRTRASVRAAIPDTIGKKVMSSWNTTDTGKPVLVNRTKQGLGEEWSFDVKTLIRYPNPAVQDGSTFSVKFPELKRRPTSVSSKLLKSQHLKTFVSTFQEAQSFGELSDALRTAILWCKSNKLGSEAFFLGMKLLKSRRLQHVEAQGCSLQKKLGCVKSTICKYITHSSCSQRPHKILKAHSCLQRQIKFSKKSRCVSKRTSYIQPHQDSGVPFFVQWSEHLPQVGIVGTSGATATVEAAAAHREDAGVVVLEGNADHIDKEATESKDDIDDIFGVLGL